MKAKRRIYLTLWWVYLAALVVFVAVKFRGSFHMLWERAQMNAFGWNYNLVPFATIGEQAAHFHEGWARVNLFGNILAFAPFGFLLPLAFEKADRWGRVLLVGVLFILLIEIFQYCTGLGSFDVDDILLNMLGVAGGYFGARVLGRLAPKR